MIEYRAVIESDYDAVRGFLAENGWQERVADEERFRIMMANATRSIAAIEGGSIVGYARALCDGVSNGYIGTVAVAPDKRGNGIGRELVSRLMGDDPAITWVLRAGRGSAGFWNKMGFEPSKVAMERNRT